MDAEFVIDKVSDDPFADVDNAYAAAGLLWPTIPDPIHDYLASPMPDRCYFCGRLAPRHQIGCYLIAGMRPPWKKWRHAWIVDARQDGDKTVVVPLNTIKFLVLTKRVWIDHSLRPAMSFRLQQAGLPAPDWSALYASAESQPDRAKTRDHQRANPPGRF